MRLGDNYRRMPNIEGAYGPKDDPRDNDTRVFRCPCGITYEPGCWWTAHDFKPCDR